MPEMSFANIYEQLSAEFPELKEAYQRLCDDEVSSTNVRPESYELIEMFFAFYVETLLRMNASQTRDQALDKSFRFIERMLASADDDLAGLAEIGIIEGREAWWFQKAEPFVGPHWRAAAKRMDEGWTQALDLSPQKPTSSMLVDLFGIRQAIAEQVKAEGLILQDIPGVTHLS